MEPVLKHIEKIAASIGMPDEALTLYGKHKAKVSHTLFDASRAAASKLILVTSTTPNKAGVGKTTTSIALGQGLKQLGKKAVVALREPSLAKSVGVAPAASAASR